MMEEYYFLFILAGVVALFAGIQDLKGKEIANWLNFSFIGFALAYRAFYSVFSNDWKFFSYGLIGFGIFLIIGNLLYYGKVFAGGDAKLLMGFGAILPFENVFDFLIIGSGFIFVLFFIGAIYSLIWSVSIVLKNKKKFAREFRKKFENVKGFKHGFVIGLLVILFGLIFFRVGGVILILGLIVMLSLLYGYLGAVDKCMIVLKNPGDLQEGDWLEKSVKIGKERIEKSVHGLSLEEIEKLKKAKKKVLVKEGIMFAPVFFLTWIALGVFFLKYGRLWYSFL